MIPVRGYAGHKVAVLGLGRSGMPTVAALRGRRRRGRRLGRRRGRARAAAADGMALADLTRARSWDGVRR